MAKQCQFSHKAFKPCSLKRLWRLPPVKLNSKNSSPCDLLVTQHLRRLLFPIPHGAKALAKDGNSRDSSSSFVSAQCTNGVDTLILPRSDHMQMKFEKMLKYANRKPNSVNQCLTIFWKWCSRFPSYACIRKSHGVRRFTERELIFLENEGHVGQRPVHSRACVRACMRLFVCSSCLSVCLCTAPHLSFHTLCLHQSASNPATSQPTSTSQLLRQQLSGGGITLLFLTPPSLVVRLSMLTFTFLLVCLSACLSPHTSGPLSCPPKSFFWFQQLESVLALQNYELGQQSHNRIQQKQGRKVLLASNKDHCKYMISSLLHTHSLSMWPQRPE